MQSTFNPERSFIRAALVVALGITGAAGAQTLPQASPEGSVQQTLRSQQKWIFAYTGRLPLDPLEAWNQQPATVHMDGDRVILSVAPPYRDTKSVFPLQVQADGFSFDWPGQAKFFMRLDEKEPNAPFKGRTGDTTVWLLRTQ